MKIISIRKGFTADHSSTSYEFLAADQPLDQAAREEVSSLSSRVQPSRRRSSFIYHAEGYDIPGGWKPLMKEHYDVMYSESYGWWKFSLAFDLEAEEQGQKLKQYDFTGVENLGIEVEIEAGRAVITIYAWFEYIAPPYRDWSIFDGINLGSYEPEDYLLALLNALRVQIKNGDYTVLYRVWKEYYLPLYEEDEYEELDLYEPEKYYKSNSVVKAFCNMLSGP